MAARLLFSKSELGLLSSLLKYKVRFMVVGLSDTLNQTRQQPPPAGQRNQSPA